MALSDQGKLEKAIIAYLKNTWDYENSGLDLPQTGDMR